MSHGGVRLQHADRPQYRPACFKIAAKVGFNISPKGGGMPLELRMVTDVNETNGGDRFAVCTNIT